MRIAEWPQKYRFGHGGLLIYEVLPAARLMRAAATDFNNTSVFDVFAVFAAIFAVRTRRAVAGSMRAFLVSRLVRHKHLPTVQSAP